jgi:hypothetical protein
MMLVAFLGTDTLRQVKAAKAELVGVEKSGGDELCVARFATAPLAGRQRAFIRDVEPVSPREFNCAHPPPPKRPLIR